MAKSRKDKLKQKELAREKDKAKALARLNRRETQIQKELKTNYFGFWKVALNGRTAHEMINKSVFFGDWHDGLTFKNRRVFHIEYCLFNRSTGKAREIEGFKTEPIYFDDLWQVTNQWKDEYFADGGEYDLDDFKSFMRVRT